MINPFLGIVFHGIGGFAAGTFYLPLKQVKDWSWESAWLLNGMFAWLLVPWIIASLTVNGLIETLSQVEVSTLLWTYFFGLLWGIGGLTFGMTMRYLGMSLGMALALGLTAAFGTLIPPIFNGTFNVLISTNGGMIILLGVAVSLTGIVICGKAGMLKEKELQSSNVEQGVAEFNLYKGVVMALIAGILSACFAFGIEAGKPIAAMSIENQTPALWSNGGVFVVILLGGLTTNLIYCSIQIWKNKNIKDFKNTKGALRYNYLFAALAGISWYFQFMFYGMGTTQMGERDFTSWTLHMVFIIIFSSFWGLVTKEWKGAGRKTMIVLGVGLAVLIMSTVIIGIGTQNSL